MGTKLVVSLTAAFAAAAPASAYAVVPHGTYVIPERAPASSTLAPELRDIGPGLILYFNRNQATYTPGNDDSRTNRSSVPTSTTTLAAWECGDAKWQQFMTCIKAQYAPFNVTVTDVDPGSTPHVETHVGGDPTVMRTQQDPGGLPCTNAGCVGGIAPLGCFGGIDNAITYVFSAAPFYNCNAQVLCETAAQESAHAFGLDHEAYCPDPMTYQGGCGAKEFRDHTANCGEYPGQPVRDCACPGTGTTQNSYQTLLGIFGPAPATPENQPPSCSITSPGAGATVSAGFGIVVDASDDSGVSKVDLYIDGALVTFKSAAPYTFSAPAALAPGTHTVQARAIDAAGLTGTSSVSVTLGQPVGCSSTDDCPSGQTCTDHQCVVVSTPAPGEIGSPCTQGSDCASGQCGAGPGGMLCTESCDPSASPTSCPAGFECLATGSGGACWPGSGGGGGTGDAGPGGNGATDGAHGFTGGCRIAAAASASTSPAPAALVLLALLALPLVRRRRRW
jgi:MYXO-CTERM domain-containing protein